MANVTVNQVRETCPSSLPDSAIESILCMVNDKVGECLDASYSECEAYNIQLYLACHIIYLTENPQRVESFSAPNGTKESYKNYTTENGLGSTSFGKLILLLDKSGCVQQNTSTPFWLQSVGSTNPPRYRD